MSRRTLAHTVLGAAVGAATWTATEYATHRWVLHGPFGSGRLKRVAVGSMHRAHHRDPLRTSLAARTAGHLAIAGVASVGALGLGRLTAAAFARSVAAAWSAGYSTYEITHWNAHHRAARTKWGERLRERHHRHHYGAPAANLGVTIGFWDRVFDTEAAASPAAAPSEAAA